MNDEIIDIGNLSDLDNSFIGGNKNSGSSKGGNKSVNFGGGLELLIMIS